MARYFYHVNKDNASVYFMVPKCATRTIMRFFNIPKKILITHRLSSNKYQQLNFQPFYSFITFLK